MPDTRLRSTLAAHTYTAMQIRNSGQRGLGQRWMSPPNPLVRLNVFRQSSSFAGAEARFPTITAASSARLVHHRARRFNRSGVYSAVSASGWAMATITSHCGSVANALVSIPEVIPACRRGLLDVHLVIHVWSHNSHHSV